MPRRTVDAQTQYSIDYQALFSQTFADYYQFPDPNDASHNMTLCELVNAGLVNEVRIAFNKVDADSAQPEILEYKQVYDENNVAIPGQFDTCAGNGCFDAIDVPAVAACGRSLRIGFFEMNAEIGASLHVNGHNFENLRFAVPRYAREFEPFANFDLQTRLGLPFQSWYEACAWDATDHCVTGTGDNSVSWLCDAGTSCAGQMGTISPFNQGCGNTHFPPNGRSNYDYYNPTAILSTCEHYGLHDGPGGADLQVLYSADRTAAFAAMFDKDPNGGGWQTYWFQNFPGLHNQATNADGSPMKNWWVYLFY
jgi:hypothetical protein